MKMEKKSKKSKSLEEISKIPKPKEDLSRKQTTRQSLQTVGATQVDTPLRHTRSHNYGKNKKIPPTIRETEGIEEEDDETVKIEMSRMSASEVRSSQVSKNSSRSKSGSTSRTRKDSGAHENKGFDGNLDSVSVISSRSFERDPRSHSARSSTRASSISLEVHREQYCCKTKWTACERRLSALVVILVTIIIILLVAIAVVAGEA